MPRGLVPVLLVALCAALTDEARGGAALDSWLADIGRQHAAGVEAAIALLPADLRSEYVLVFASRSLQAASLTAPRAVLFGTDARFIVTFNGDPAQRGYDAVETMEFDERTGSFHFRELKFTADGTVELSADNPARCVACHGRPARPIWDLPPLWPGVYGERYRAGLSEAESSGMQAFLRRQPTDPRYRHLIAPARFAERATYAGSARARYEGDRGEPPNFRLTALLAAEHQQALIAALAAAPGFARYRYLLAAAADGHCGDPAALLPAGHRAAFSAERDQRLAGAVPLRAREETERRSRRLATADSYRAGFTAVNVAELRLLAELVVGLPAQRWSLSLDSDVDNQLLVDGGPGPGDLLGNLLEAGDPEIRDRRAVRTFDAADPYCGYLRAAGQRALAEAATPLPAAPVAAGRPAGSADPGRPTLVNRCASCHTGEVGPKLPFDDPAMLRVALRAVGYPRGRLLDEILFRLTPGAGRERMPRGIMTSQAEEAALEEYFLSLAAP